MTGTKTVGKNNGAGSNNFYKLATDLEKLCTRTHSDFESGPQLVTCGRCFTPLAEIVTPGENRCTSLTSCYHVTDVDLAEGKLLVRRRLASSQWVTRQHYDGNILECSAGQHRKVCSGKPIAGNRRKYNRPEPTRSGGMPIPKAAACNPVALDLCKLQLSSTIKPERLHFFDLDVVVTLPDGQRVAVEFTGNPFHLMGWYQGASSYFGFLSPVIVFECYDSYFVGSTVTGKYREYLYNGHSTPDDLYEILVDMQAKGEL